jgi:hypothetical protein
MIILGIFTFKIFQAKNGVLSESLAKLKEENEALGEKLREAEEKAQMAKNAVKNIAIKFTHSRFLVGKDHPATRESSKVGGIISQSDCHIEGTTARCDNQQQQQWRAGNYTESA